MISVLNLVNPESLLDRKDSMRAHADFVALISK